MMDVTPKCWIPFLIIEKMELQLQNTISAWIRSETIPFGGRQQLAGNFYSNGNMAQRVVYC